MIRTKAIAALVVAAAIGTGASVAPAVATTTTTHWSSAQCQTWQHSFLKRNPRASKTRKAQANKVLKNHGCTLRIK